LCDKIYRNSKNYFTVTVAPASANLALKASISSSFAFSLMIQGAFSTKSLASFNQSPNKSFTTLITAIFCPPISVSSMFEAASQAAQASHPAAGAHAATTVAAAVTPNFSSIALTSSFNSIALIQSIKSIIVCAFFDNSILNTN
jgi:hypothetical protein